MKLKMPDITLAQITAILTFIAGQAVTMGLADEETTKILLSSGITLATVALGLFDAFIRRGRANIAAAAATNAQLAGPIEKDETRPGAQRKL